MPSNKEKHKQITNTEINDTNPIEEIPRSYISWIILGKYTVRFSNLEKIAFKNKIYLPAVIKISIYGIKIVIFIHRMKKYIFTFLILCMISSCSTYRKGGCDCPGMTNHYIEKIC